jgi:hypothetical protein
MDDLEAVKLIISSKHGSAADLAIDGTSLLHVCFQDWFILAFPLEY